MSYDTIIIGSGPAGLTASIYASRYKLSNLVVGKLPGGTITYAHKVENFPGFISISGVELGQRMMEQAKSLGTEILGEMVIRAERSEGDTEVDVPFARVRQTPPPDGGVEHVRLAESHISPCRLKIVTETNKEFQAKTLIVAVGTERRKLGVPGETEYLGKGVSYCVTCDAPFFKGKTVVLVGGSNAACSGASHMAEYAEKVYLIYRKSELRAEPVWVEEVKSNPKIEVIYNTNLTEILGDGARVTGARLDIPYKENSILSTDGVFVEIGGVPAVDFIKPLGVETGEEGYIKVNEKMETSVGGVFAAGDVTDKSLILSQAITACAQGAIAANSAFAYLKSKNL